MADAPHGLIILFEGFPATVIRSQVVALAAWLAEEGIARMDLVSFACTAAIQAQAQRRLAEVHAVMRAADTGAEVQLYRGIRPALPGAAVWHRRLVNAHLRARPGRYAFVHARTDYAASVVAPVATRAGIPMIWDCRGDAAAEFRDRMGAGRYPPVVARARVRQLDAQSRVAARGCRDAIFVTEVLRERWRTEVKGRTFVVPTAADERAFFLDAALRAATRGALELEPATPLFVFSGSLAPYQGFGHALAYFAAVRRSEPRARLLVLTPEVERARAMIGEQPGTLVRSARYEDMNAYLNAADYALLCRPASAVNRAAFPTKFAEYGLAGLPVVLSDATPACEAFAREAGNFIDCGAPAACVMPDPRRRAAVAEAFRRGLALASYRDVYRALYH